MVSAGWKKCWFSFKCVQEKPCVTFEQRPERGENQPRGNLGKECSWQREQPIQNEKDENMPKLLEEQQADQHDQ